MCYDGEALSAHVVLLRYPARSLDGGLVSPYRIFGGFTKWLSITCPSSEYLGSEWSVVVGASLVLTADSLFVVRVRVNQIRAPRTWVVGKRHTGVLLDVPWGGQNVSCSFVKRRVALLDVSINAMHYGRKTVCSHHGRIERNFNVSGVICLGVRLRYRVTTATISGMIPFINGVMLWF